MRQETCPGLEYATGFQSSRQALLVRPTDGTANVTLILILTHSFQAGINSSLFLDERSKSSMS